MLKAPSEENGGVKDVAERLKEDDNEEREDGHIAFLFRESIYHKAIKADDESIEDRFKSSEFGDNPRRQIDELLK